MTSKRTRNLAAVAALPLVLVILVWNRRGPQEDAPPTPALVASPVGSPQIAQTPVAPALPAGARTYAVATSELRGLPPLAPPGAVLDLWVAWDPPLANKAKVEPLLEHVVLSEIIEPLTAEGPRVAVLAVTPAQAEALVFAARYGQLSVLMHPPE